MSKGITGMTYKLIDQTSENFFPVASRQWLICKQDVTPERTCTRAFCVVPRWEDRSSADSKADAEMVVNALISALDPATAIKQAMAAVESAGCHSLLTDAIILLEQAGGKIADLERARALCLLCGHKREQHDPDNIAGNCNAVQCQCAGFILMK